MRNSKLQSNISLLALVSFLFFVNCSSPQKKAEASAFKGACPKFGFFTEDEIKKLIPSDPADKSGFYILEEDAGYSKKNISYVAIQTFDNKVVHREVSSLTQARKINSKDNYESFIADFKLICGSEIKPIEKTKFELDEEKKLQVENSLKETEVKLNKIKQSKVWTQAIKDSFEYDYDEKGEQFKLAHFNSKQNDILNKIDYSENPTQETKDRKVWDEIKKKKYVFVSKDNSQKYTFFYTDDYNVKYQIYPIYFEINDWYGYTSILPESGIKVRQLESDRIQIKISPELATKIENGTKYNLDVIFSTSIQMNDYSYNYVYDNGLHIVLDDEKTNMIKNADPYLYSRFSKRTGKGKTITLKPIYYIFSIPEENVIITNIKG